MEAEATERKVEELSGRIQGCARDFLRRFGGNTCYDEPPEVVAAAAREEVEEIELSSRVVSGRSFWSGARGKKRRLVRSSSIATLSMFPLENDFPVAAPLTRACSLPTEAEEHRKRKKLHSLKRLGVKRKRWENKNLSKLVARDLREESSNEVMNARHRRALPPSASTAAGAQQGDTSRCFRPALAVHRIAGE